MESRLIVRVEKKRIFESTNTYPSFIVKKYLKFKTEADGYTKSYRFNLNLKINLLSLFENSIEMSNFLVTIIFYSI